MKRIAIFASGNGTNAERILEYFSANKNVKIDLILTNNPNAGVLKRARKFDTETMVFTREELYRSDKVVDTLLKKEIDFVILAGFLWLIPSSILKQFSDRIINIHPALLPKYGGKGMFGHHVHEAVIANKEKKSGITIHYVNEHYDKGNIIFQATCEITNDETADSLASKIHDLEYQHFPVVIEKLLNSN